MKSLYRNCAIAAAMLVLAACATMEPAMVLDPNAQVPEAGENVQ